MLRLSQYIAINASMKITFPTSQSELIRSARGGNSQRAFARELDVSPSSMSRYESEQLGAPVSVITRCLTIVSRQLLGPEPVLSPAETALFHARSAVTAIERVVPRSRRVRVPGPSPVPEMRRNARSRPHKSGK